MRLIYSEDTPAISSVKIRDALQQYHPPKPPDRRDLPPPNQGVAQTPLTAISATVLEEIRSFPAGSSGGPDGLTSHHLKDLVADNMNSELLEAVMSLVNLMLAGGQDRNVNEIIYVVRRPSHHVEKKGQRTMTNCHRVYS